MKKLLGKIVDSFTIQDIHRVVVLDRDCSADLKVGDTIEVKFLSGGSTAVKVLDAFLTDGSEFKIETEKIASLKVENRGFPNESIVDCQIFLK